MADLGVREKNELRRELSTLLAVVDRSSKLRSMIPAVQSILTALDYGDPTLLKSATEWSSEEMTAVANRLVTEELAATDKLEAAFQAISGIALVPSRTTDELGRLLRALIEHVIKRLTDLRDGVVRKAVECGLTISNADRLESDIARLGVLNERYLIGWPRSDGPLPTADRGMVERSRAEFDRDEGIPVEELIRQFGVPDRG